MALSYNKLDQTSRPIAIRKYTHTSKNKTVFFTENPEDKPVGKGDVTVEHLENMFGKTAIRYPKHHDELRDRLLDTISDDMSKKRPMNILKIGDKSEFVILPMSEKDQVRNIYIAGRAGSGKSTLAIKLTTTFTLLGIPKSRIILICNKKDPKFEEISTYRDINDFVEIDKDNNYDTLMALYIEKKIRFKHKKKQFDPDKRLALEIEIEKLKPIKQDKQKGYKITDAFKKFVEGGKPSLFVFDDIEAMDTKNRDKAFFLANYVGISERKNNVNVIFISHQMTKSHLTRDLLNEASDYILFKTTQAKQLSYFSREYLKFPREVTTRLLNTHKELSRYGFMLINKIHNYVITEKKCFLV